MSNSVGAGQNWLFIAILFRERYQLIKLSFPHRCELNKVTSIGRRVYEDNGESKNSLIRAIREIVKSNKFGA